MIELKALHLVAERSRSERTRSDVLSVVEVCMVRGTWWCAERGVKVYKET